jgi:PAS domain S-box-containing protein
LAATAISAIGTDYFFLEPRHSLAITSHEAIANLTLFVVVGVIISFLVGNLRALLLSAARADGVLRESETQFRTLVNLIPELCWIANEEGWIFWYNQRWYEYTDTTPSQMEGWGWKSFHDPAILPPVMDRWQDAIATGDPFEMVVPLRGADGEHRPFLTRVTPMRNKDGKIIRWFGASTDISEQRKTEEALRASEARYSTLAEVLPAIVFTASPDGNLDYVNRRWYEYSGLTFKQTLDAGWAAVVHPEDYELSSAGWIAAMESGAPYEVELRLRRADGVHRWFRVRATPLRDRESGRILKWLGISSDIDDEKKSQERFRESQKLEAIGRLAGGVAHDFNNILTVINGYNDFLLEHLRHSPVLFGYAQEVKGAADRAGGLTRQLLAVSRRQVAQPKVLDLNGVVLDIRRLLVRVIGEDIELITSLVAEPLMILADPVQLDQIIMKLVVIERDSMTTGGRLKLETA